MQVRNWLARWLTRGYVRTLDFGGVSREETYRASGEERQVFWVDAEKWPAAGQCTLFGTIVLNEDRLGDVPDKVVDYVFLHEVGHTKPPTILNLLSILVRIPLGFLAIFGVPVLIGRWLGFVLSAPDLDQFTMFSVATVIGILLILVPLVVIWWLDEGYADLFVVSKIGTHAYRHRYDKMNDHADRGLIGRFIRWLLYPDSDHVVWVANRRGD